MNVLKQTINCPCGSIITCKGSMYKHFKTKRHTRFVETGQTAPKDQAEYQRNYYASNPRHRDKHRQLCKSYYEKNKEQIRQRHSSNGAMLRFYQKKNLCERKAEPNAPSNEMYV